MKTNKICPYNWDEVLDNPTPKAVRWALRDDRFRNPIWTKWHYSEGNFHKTACGRSIVPFIIDGSPQEHGTDNIDCKRCLAKIKTHTAKAI